jgi:hypothetical protein
MQSNGIEMIVRVKNRIIMEYNHDNQTFIEGRAGSNYEIEIHNHTLTHVDAVISVDGLSVIDGKSAGSHSTGYLVEPQDTIKVPGWMLSPTSVAKFAFAGRLDSYASQMSAGKSPNNGVIGVLVFGAKHPATYRVQTNPNWWPTYSDGEQKISGGQFRDRGATKSNSDYDRPRGIAPSSTADRIRGIQCSASAAAPAVANYVPVQQSLGTAFGEQSAFATRPVSFERGTILTTISVYYDNLKGLRARGVPIERRGRYRQQPSAFPGLNGCELPPGWRG